MPWGRKSGKGERVFQDDDPAGVFFHGKKVLPRAGDNRKCLRLQGKKWGGERGENEGKGNGEIGPLDKKGS